VELYLAKVWLSPTTNSWMKKNDLLVNMVTTLLVFKNPQLKTKTGTGYPSFSRDKKEV